MKKEPATAASSRQGLSFNTRLCGMAQVITNAYHNGGALAVELVDNNGEGIATLSVNMPELSHLLGDGEFFAKTWSENHDIAEDALASGVFRDTGRTSGDTVNAHIWTFR